MRERLQRFELYKSAKRYDYATLPFCEVYQLGAGIAYVERVGVDRIEQHTVALAKELRAGLAAQGHGLFTPEGNASSIVTLFFSRDPRRYGRRSKRRRSIRRCVMR